MTARPTEWITDNAAWAGAAPRLSVLIPFMRDDPTRLLAALDREGEAVEMIVLDDGSGDPALARRPQKEKTRAVIEAWCSSSTSTSRASLS